MTRRFGERTVSETGTEFLRALVKNLATVMGTAGAWVMEYFPEQRWLRAHAMWMQGRFMDDFECRVAGTPCEDVVDSKRLINIPDKLVELYPGDPDLISLQPLSYLGIALLDTDGSVMGHLSVLDTKLTPLHSRPVVS